MTCREYGFTEDCQGVAHVREAHLGFMGRNETDLGEVYAEGERKVVDSSTDTCPS
jgi:hypothetical protein